MASTWLITGISRGFGAALARAVLASGHHVVGTTRDGNRPDGLSSNRLTVIALDVGEPDQIDRTVEDALKATGRIDVLVNNAGYGLLGSVETAAEADIRQVFAVNFFGPAFLIQKVLPIMRRQRSGHIVNITSIAGVVPAPGSGFYAAAKAALEGLSQALSQEVEPLGIRVTAVAPGAFRTEFLGDNSIRKGAPEPQDYAGTSGVALANLMNRAGRQIGDPERGAAAIVELVGLSLPPANLILGSDALARMETRLAKLQAEVAEWAHLSCSSDQLG